MSTTPIQPLAGASTRATTTSGPRRPDGEHAGASRLRSIGGAAGAGLALVSTGALLAWRGFTAHSRPVATGKDANSVTRRALGGGAGIQVEEAVTVNRPAAELFQFWRDFTNLPRFMPHLEKVEMLSNGRSRWRARGPGGYRVSWQAEVFNEVPDQIIAWRSVGRSALVTAGSVHFDDAGEGRGTKVRVKLQYNPPGGRAGAAVAKLFGRDAGASIREDLRKFKQLLETGEIATTRGQSRGRS